MPRHLPLCAVVAALCTLAFAIAPINAETESEADELLVIVYSVGDLPVWSFPTGDNRKTGFDPSVLTTLISTTVDTNSWLGDANMTAHRKTASLVIRQTRENHRRIADLLQRFRKVDPREERTGLK